MSSQHPTQFHVDLTSEFDTHLVSGADAYSFLQNQFAADLQQLSDHSAVWTCWCDARGNVRWMGHVIRETSNRWWLLGDREFSATLHKLRMFILRSDVSIQRAGIRAAVCAFGANTLEQGASQPGEFLIDAQRFIALTSNEDIHTLTTAPLPAHHWRALGALRGECQLAAADCITQIPQNLGMQEGAGFSLRKGCYPGQEIISRVHYRGRPPRRLHTSIAHHGLTDAGFSAPLPETNLTISQALRSTRAGS